MALTIEQKREFNRMMNENRRLKNVKVSMRDTGGGDLGKMTLRNTLAKEQSDARKAKAIALFDEGLDADEVAKEMRMGLSTIRGYLRGHVA